MDRDIGIWAMVVGPERRGCARSGGKKKTMFSEKRSEMVVYVMDDGKRKISEKMVLLCFFFFSRLYCFIKREDHEINGGYED